MIRPFIIALAVVFWTSCDSPTTRVAGPVAQEGTAGSEMAVEEEALKTTVDRFLVAIGNYDLEAVQAMFAANANIGAVNLREGEWQTNTYTFEDFYARLQARSNPTPYQEPVSHYTVHVEPGGLAFVRADATLISNGEARSHNIDYFTLVKEDGTWKFLSAAYIATPISTD